MDTDLTAFVDEFGDTSIAVEKPGVTSFFIITAVLVPGDVEIYRKRAETIRARFFQTGEMKSSKIAARDDRRVTVLKELGDAGIRSYTLAVDKRELNRESGLAYRPSFFKRLNRMLYSTICRAHDNVTFVADEHGTDEFMAGFREYVNRELRPTLFSQRLCRFANSSEEVLIQVADVISGSWARVLEPAKRSTKSAEIAKHLATASIGLEVWPPRMTPELLFPVQSTVEGHDELVRRHCYLQAVQFLEENDGGTTVSEQVGLQVEVLKFLLFKLRWVDDASFFSTDEILQHLGVNAGLQLTKYQLRTTVIGPLRDAGVIVASGREGYKIPTREADLMEFAAHAQSIIPPMLSRLRKARQELKLVSLGTLDILGAASFAELRALIDAHDSRS